MKSERGQAALGIVLIVAVFVIAFLLIGMAANQRGMQAGAEVIGESVGEAIDDITAAELAVSFWVNSQRNIVPNKHAIERHGADAWATVDCYNRNGTFHIMSKKNGEFHLLCRDDDGSVRDMILKRRSPDSGEFDFVNAFTPKRGVFRDVLNWLIRDRAGKASMPDNVVIYVDGVIP